MSALIQISFGKVSLKAIFPISCKTHDLFNVTQQPHYSSQDGLRLSCNLHYLAERKDKCVISERLIIVYFANRVYEVSVIDLNKNALGGDADLH